MQEGAAQLLDFLSQRSNLFQVKLLVSLESLLQEQQLISEICLIDRKLTFLFSFHRCLPAFRYFGPGFAATRPGLSFQMGSVLCAARRLFRKIRLLVLAVHTLDSCALFTFVQKILSCISLSVVYFLRIVLVVRSYQRMKASPACSLGRLS